MMLWHFQPVAAPSLLELCPEKGDAVVNAIILAYADEGTIGTRVVVRPVTLLEMVIWFELFLCRWGMGHLFMR